jgi:hypothetical protein
MKRCSRQKWLVKSQQDKADAIVTSRTALSENVRKGSDVLSETLADMTRETRHILARAALRSARKVKSVSIRTAKDLRDAAAAVISLEGERKGEGEFTLNVLNVGGSMNIGT